MVRLAEAVPVTGGLMFELLEVNGKAMPKGGGGRTGRTGGRKLPAHKKKQSKMRKVARRKQGR